MKTSRDASAQCEVVNATGCGFDNHSRKFNVYLNLYFHFFALAWGQNVALNSANQFAILHNSAENGERGVLTVSLGFLSLSATCETQR